MIKKMIKKIYFMFVDQYAFDNNDKRISFLERFLVSTRLKFTRVGIFFSKKDRKLNELKDKYKGKRCFIIGNGPSLNSLDLTLLKDEHTFGVNAIYLNYEKMNFHPTFHVVEDIFVGEDRCDEISSYKGPEYKFYGNYFRNIIMPDENTIFINILRNYADEKNFPLFSHNIVRYLGVGGSVTYICLQLAYHLGFDEVYMIGFDHNYKIPESVIIENKRDTGFDILSTEDDVNHFHKDYFGKGYRWHDPKVERMEVGFLKAKSEFEKDGRKIYNATYGGKLDVFERVEYNSLFK